MQKVQKTYTPEFKREAVRLAQTSGKPIAQVARELGISDTSIHQWRKELSEHGREAFPGSGHQTAQEEELRQLKRELERVRQERDILKRQWPSFRAASRKVPVHRRSSAGVSGQPALHVTGRVNKWVLRLEEASDE
jgi:transposase